MKKILLTGLAFFALCSVLLTAWVLFALSDLPDVSILKNYRPAAAAEVLDKDGSVLTSYFDRKYRIWIPISSLPDIVIHAVVTAEDDTFFDHRGVNYKATWEALVHDIQKKRFARGGSTITQQMIKNVLLSREKTLTRKLREYVLARKAEEVLTKRQILQIYLNEVEWGDNIYGIEAASRYYLDKHATDLSAAEAALLAGMLPSPRYYNPYKRADKAKDRQDRVMANMLQAKLISSDDYTAAMRTSCDLRPQDSGKLYFSAAKTANNRLCYHNALERILLRLLGDQKLYRGGSTIKTTLDKKLQYEMNMMEEAVPASTSNAPERILVIKREGRIHAMACSTENESEVFDKLVSPLSRTSDYEVSIAAIDSITREQIVLSVEGWKK